MTLLFALSGIALIVGLVFAAMGEVWGWFLWWVLGIGLGVGAAIKDVDP